MKKEFFLSVLLSFTSTIAFSETISVSAYIDGVSSLVFQGDTVHWNHSDFAAPGRWSGNDIPTIINDVDWLPEWPDSGRNDFCNCDSSSISGLFSALPSSAQQVTLNTLGSPGGVTILEQPNMLNGYSLTVEFDDFYRSGASWYNIELTYSEVPIPAGVWLFGSALLGLASVKRKRS